MTLEPSLFLTLYADLLPRSSSFEAAVSPTAPVFISEVEPKTTAGPIVNLQVSPCVGNLHLADIVTCSSALTLKADSTFET